MKSCTEVSPVCGFFFRLALTGVDLFANWLIRFMLHADLKLENILFTNSDDLDVKIADFGLAVEGSRARDVVGSLQYMAPEISVSLKQGYTAAVDCWSLGIILHGIMLGFLPYNFVSTDEVEEFAYGAPPPV